MFLLLVFLLWTWRSTNIWHSLLVFRKIASFWEYFWKSSRKTEHSFMPPLVYFLAGISSIWILQHTVPLFLTQILPPNSSFKLAHILKYFLYSTKSAYSFFYKCITICFLYFPVYMHIFLVFLSRLSNHFLN